MTNRSRRRRTKYTSLLLALTIAVAIASSCLGFIVYPARIVEVGQPKVERVCNGILDCDGSCSCEPDIVEHCDPDGYCQYYETGGWAQVTTTETVQIDLNGDVRRPFTVVTIISALIALALALSLVMMTTGRKTRTYDWRERMGYEPRMGHPGYDG